MLTAASNSSRLRVAGLHVVSTPSSTKAPPRKTHRRVRRVLSSRSVNTEPRRAATTTTGTGKSHQSPRLPGLKENNSVRGGDGGVVVVSGLLRRTPAPTPKPRVKTRSPRALPTIHPARMPFVSATAWVVADATTGRSLAGSHQFDRRCVASLTKIATASVVLQYAAVHPTLLSETVTVSKTAASTIGTSATLHTGDQLRVLDLLYGLMLPSGNDAAMALAEHVGHRVLSGSGPTVVPFAALSSLESSPRPPRPSAGAPSRRSPRVSASTRPGPASASSSSSSRTASSDPGAAARRWFVGQMNALVASWGATVTHFSNPHGMDAPNPADHQSSAADVAKIAAQAMKDPIFRKVVSTKRYLASVERVSHLEEATRTLTRHSSVRSEAMAVPSLRMTQRRGSFASVGIPSDVQGEEDGEDGEEGEDGVVDALACTSTRPMTKTLTWTNTNGMLSSRTGVNGVKTGITRTAGPCLCTQLVSGRHRPILVVVLSSASKEARYRDTFKIARFARNVLL